MTATLLEPTDTDVRGRACQIEVGDDCHQCGAPAAASTIISCPGGHADPLDVCGPHLSEARRGDMECNDCDPATPAFLIAEVPL